MRLLAFALLALSACSFQTEAVDEYMGTSCGSYVADTFTTEPGIRCWAVVGAGQCFYREVGDDVCHRPRQLFAPEDELAMWCPIGNGGEDLEFVPADCR